MAVIENDRGGVGAGAAKPKPWNDPKIRSIVVQILFAAGVVALFWWLITNLFSNMADQGIASGFGFLDREASFEISESLIPYSAADSYGRALFVGALNTFKVAILGIVLATVLGTVVGIARLSSNFLLAKLASLYVEVLRNVPLVIQLIIWYNVLIVSAPAVRDAIELPGSVFISNRGINFPWPSDEPGWTFAIVGLGIGCVLAYAFSRYARIRQDQTGQQLPVFWIGLGIVLGTGFISWLLGGAPTGLEVPEKSRFNLRGGANLTPEYFAVLLGLTIYTSAFIAEIVRAGIQSVSQGQSEAAAALGLRRGRALSLVILPQALRIIIPPTTSQYLNLTKNSSLGIVIGYADLVSIGNTTLNQTGQAVEVILIFMSVYWALSIATSLFMNWYNKKIALVER